MSKPADPTRWLESAAQIRGLGHDVRDAAHAPMFERLAARLEEIGIAKAAAELEAAERAKETKREGDEKAAQPSAPRGQTGGELNTSTRSHDDEHQTFDPVESQERTGA